MKSGLYRGTFETQTQRGVPVTSSFHLISGGGGGGAYRYYVSVYFWYIFSIESEFLGKIERGAVFGMVDASAFSWYRAALFVQYLVSTPASCYPYLHWQ